MAVEPIKYLEWAKLKSQAKISLSRSGVPDLSFQELPLTLDLKALEISGRHPYGYLPLIEAIASRYQVHPDEVVVTQGASQAIFMLGAAIIEPGDKVVVEKPAYEPLLAIPRFFKAEILRLERRFDHNFEIALDDFRKLLGKGAKLVILTNLHNPSGVWLSRDKIEALAREVERFGAYLFIDEIYLEFMDGEAASTAYGLNERIIVASSLTKVYGLGGLRCGWILAPKEITRSLRALTDYLVVEGPFISQLLASLIFPYLDLLREKNRAWLETNHKQLCCFMNRQSKLTWVEPDGGVICFPRLLVGRNGDDFCQFLREKAEISLVPGSFFEAPEHFRLGYAVAPEILAEALEIIEKVLDEW
ncbi:MAG: pyridoxal phosphate-dependent aminotransferase [Candidatus Aminicenantes bacterium]|nr:pyridoxal phosphate-dependent aminotransferase [Candidatus Aminicenantes bacterium]